MNDDSEDGPPPLLGVVGLPGNTAVTVTGLSPRRSIPVEERELLARTAAAILQESGGAVDAGQVIVLAGWLGGLD
jgi:hypothetical protein